MGNYSVAHLGPMEGKLTPQDSLYSCKIVVSSTVPGRPNCEMVASMVMVTKTNIDNFLRLAPDTNFCREVRQTVTLLPLFLLANSCKLVSLTVAAALLRYWVLPL